MTYEELYNKANRMLDNNEITIGEYEDMIEPLKVEIEPEQKTGHWYKKETFNGHWKCCCSECDYGGRFEWIACPNCGAHMKNESNE